MKKKKRDREDLRIGNIDIVSNQAREEGSLLHCRNGSKLNRLFVVSLKGGLGSGLEFTPVGFVSRHADSRSHRCRLGFGGRMQG